MSTSKTTFNSPQLTAMLLGAVSERAQDVLEKRFGLRGRDRMTLEAIGRGYGITRERVRQIENFALNSIRKSDAYDQAISSLVELREHMNDFGMIVREDDFLNHLADDEDEKNHLSFYLVLGNDFYRLKEDAAFYHRWTTDQTLASKVQTALRSLRGGLKNDDVLNEDEMIECFRTHLRQELGSSPDDHAQRWLSLSKAIDRNPLGGWGISNSPNIKIRGMRDMAYLVIRDHGSPMHFREVAAAIKKLFGRSAHEATCHNELIKDKRFVLVGRGLYALSSWGYARGTVRDVIAEMLKSNGPLSKDDIVSRVLKERYVKENTIAVNLQNGRHFGRDDNGRYFAL
ncbi:MAG: sigma factor-like helix-turn-helix DNA-binding protein [bacterium]|nr:sigma factor-like helix-turn-helix DNA-binding protein [bacterium]